MLPRDLQLNEFETGTIPVEGFDRSLHAILGRATRAISPWWPEWEAWLDARSGDLVSPPGLGAPDHAPLADAPGTYVLEK